MARTLITNTLIKQGTISGADLAAETPGQILVANASGVPTAVTMSGNATITTAGVVTVTGGGNPAFTNVTIHNATATLASSDAGLITSDASAAAIVLTLPAPSGLSGFTFEFMKIDSTANTVTIGSGSSTISGLTSYVMKYKFQHIKIRCDGISWYIDGGGPVFGELASSEMPAHFSNNSGIFESINRFQLTYQLSSAGTKNVYMLNYGTFTSQSPTGFYIPRNAIIKGMWASVGATTTSTATFNIYKNGVTTAIGSITIASGASAAKAENINALLSAGDQLALYISATANVVNPQCTIELAWKD